MGMSSGSFFVRKDAFVIIDLDTDVVTVVVDGVKATLKPMGPSLGCPEGLACSEFRTALVTRITSEYIS